MIKINLDLVMVKRGISSKELAQAVGITPANLSILKTGKAKGIRFSTLSKICAVLNCQPGDILEYNEDKIKLANEAENRKKLMNLINIAYNKVQNPRFENFKVQLIKFYKELDNDEDYLKILLQLRMALLQADLSLNIKSRISGLPTEYGTIFYFIEPQLETIDSKVLDRYSHYGFVPLKFGSTVKYE